MAQNQKPVTPQEKQRSTATVPYRSEHPGWPTTRNFWGVSPFSLMRRMMEDFDPFYGGIGPAEGRLWSPRIDVFQREGQLVVRADVPGVRKEDVNVELTDDGLVIEGERKAEQNVEQAGVHRVECTYGSFQRVIPVPEGVDIAQAKASFENGVLEVTVPLPKEQTRERRRRIEVRDKTPGTKAVH